MGGRFMGTLYFLLSFAVNLKWLKRKKKKPVEKKIHTHTMKYHFTCARITIIKRQTITSLGKEMENWKTLPLLVGMLTCTAALENSLSIS